MLEATLVPPVEPESELTAIRPNVSHIITEDDKPVDNLPSEKQQRLLVEPLYASAAIERPFLAADNGGSLYALHQTHVVPDMFLSLSVDVDDD